MLDVEKIVTGLHEYMAMALRPLSDRIKSLELTGGPRGDKGDPGAEGAKGIDGKDGLHGKDGIPGERGMDGMPGRDGIDGKDGRDGIDGKDGRDGIDGKDGRDGIDGIQGELGPQGEKGADGMNGRDGADGLAGKDGINGTDGKDGRDGIDGKDGLDGTNGKDASPLDIEKAAEVAVARVVSSIPAPKDGIDGKSIDPAEVEQMVLRAVAEIPKPQDGKDGRDGLKGDSITVEDVRPLLEGELAKWQLEFERRSADVLQRAIDRMPAAKDGADGMNIDDFDASLKDGKTIVLSLRSGDRVIQREIQLAIPIDCGVYKSGDSYRAGDGVTYAGSFWIAQTDTKASPTSSADWRLAVKRGRDGKDAA